MTMCLKYTDFFWRKYLTPRFPTAAAGMQFTKEHIMACFLNIKAASSFIICNGSNYKYHIIIIIVLFFLLLSINSDKPTENDYSSPQLYRALLPLKVSCPELYIFCFDLFQAGKGKCFQWKGSNTATVPSLFRTKQQTRFDMALTLCCPSYHYYKIKSYFTKSWQSWCNQSDLVKSMYFLSPFFNPNIWVCWIKIFICESEAHNYDSQNHDILWELFGLGPL